MSGFPARAGDRVAIAERTALRGLSPRVRGNLPRSEQRVENSVTGLSPRVRGNRERRHSTRRRCRVYPRACGGTGRSLVRERSPMAAGLSPRVRGNRQAVHRLLRWPEIRVYPRACGGTTFLAAMADRSNLRVYPRACGGTLYSVTNLHAGGHGSIPARAGEPTIGVAMRVGSITGLSPRVRGNRKGMTLNNVGLSLRVRGNLACEPTRQSGVYPRACGGTCSVANHHNKHWVYRACPNITRRSVHIMGLSPRVRGNLSPLEALRGVGVYPRACGGTRAWPRHQDWVYPRACGGTSCNQVLEFP